MCGIAGKITERAPVDRATLEAMCEAIRHRGPDSGGTHLDGPVALGMRRLAVLDLETGEQPFYSEDERLVLVLNGEIYNHLELRSELEERGHRFRSHSDAEVVVHLWEEAGPSCLERLRGMFALAVWDDGERRLHLARDRLGKKPLYFALRDGTLWFGSEPQAILADPDVPRDTDPAAIDRFLVNGYVPSSDCTFAALRKLAPGSVLTWGPRHDLRIERYWRLDYEPKLAVGFSEAVEMVRETLFDATRIRLGSDVPVGAFLSGGLDSSAVVAAMAHTSPTPVRTFAVSFAEQEVDESPWARAVAERYGTIHEEIEVGPPHSSLLPRLARHLGEPLADPAAIPTFQLAEATRRRVTVALSGDGGDEAFAGYQRYWKLAASRPAEAIPLRLREAAAGLFARSGDPRRLGGRVLEALAQPPARRYGLAQLYFRPQDRRELYGPMLVEELSADRGLAHIERAWAERAGLAWRDRVSAVDVATYLPDDLLPKLDLTSMASALEVRSPLLDQELISLAARLPASYKLQGREGKRVLRAAVEPLLPAGVLARPKHGFEVPLASWLRGPLAAICEEVLLDPSTLARGAFQRAAVERALAEHRAGADQHRRLWPMLCLELWFRNVVEAPIPAAAVLAVGS